MVSETELYLKRAEEKVLLAKLCFDISTKSETKKYLGVSENQTFFNDIISLSYYSIFYSAKAYLISKGIITSPPEEHKKTYEEFANFVRIGVLDKELLDIYENAAIEAETLLNIFFIGKRNRGKFTYNVNANANLPFASDSIENAKKFTRILTTIVKGR